MPIQRGPAFYLHSRQILPYQVLKAKAKEQFYRARGLPVALGGVPEPFSVPEEFIPDNVLEEIPLGLGLQPPGVKEWLEKHGGWIATGLAGIVLLYVLST